MTSPAHALRDAAPVPYWLDRPGAPDPAPRLTTDRRADLLVIGGGYSGLWTALAASRRHPDLEIVVVEAGRTGSAASGRNGGFVEPSLTHGLRNGLDRFPDELRELERLGRANLAELETDLATEGIDGDLERTGMLELATRPWHLDALADDAALHRAFGYDAVALDRDAVRVEVDSPTYLGGLAIADGGALVDPARLAWGLHRAVQRRGITIAEHTPVTDLALEGRAGGVVVARTPYAIVRAPRVALATNAFPPLLRRLRRRFVPVYDYAVVTEPLAPDQRRAIGWAGRQGLSDMTNLFHYYRLTADDRVLFGGHDAVYHWRSRVAAELEQRPATFRTLAEHFHQTFPQLEAVRFTHAWGGAIDTSSRFSAFFGTALGGRVAYALGYTGLGVAATRFGAEVMLDLLEGADTPRTRLRFVRTRPPSFPPEPVRSAGIALTTRSLASADRAGGRRNLWLRTLDRLGLGFDS